MSRTQNSLRNMKYAIVGQVIGLIISFFVRIVFVHTLSVEYLGIDGLFVSILSMLSFAELGVGYAIVFSLYKPLAEQNIAKIKTLMSLYRRAYITIGTSIAILGIALTPFLSLLIKEMPDIPYIHFIYLMFVGNSAISYFFSYKRSLIIADQNRYIATFYRYGFYFLYNIAQIIILLLTHNYLLFLVCLILGTFLENIFVSRKAEKLYPFLREKNTEKLDKETSNEIVRNVKAMIFHKTGAILVNSTDSILISKFVGVVAVGINSNYLMITNALNTVFSLVFQAVTASIGNLGVTETRRTEGFFRVLDFVAFWLYGFASVSLLVLFNPFIALWVGEDYLFPMEIVAIIVANFYLRGMRFSIETFRDALGLFWQDRFKPFAESTINLVASVVLGLKFGLFGIFIGTTICYLTSTLWIGPYVLYKYGFQSSPKIYFKKSIQYLLATLVALMTTFFLCSSIDNTGIINFIIKLIICIIVPNAIFLAFFYRTKEFKYLWAIFKNNIFQSDTLKL